jgi:hypothetical protein
MGVPACALPTTPDKPVESDEQQDEQKSAGEAMPSIAASVSVVPVRSEVGTMNAVGIPERPEDEAEDNRDCDEDENGWDEDEGKHRVFSIRIRGRGTRPPDVKLPVGLDGQG